MIEITACLRHGYCPRHLPDHKQNESDNQADIKQRLAEPSPSSLFLRRSGEKVPPNSAFEERQGVRNVVCLTVRR